MSATLIIIIIGIGILLMFIESFLLPGTGIVGILGGILSGGGVLLCYDAFGNYYGNISLIITLVIIFISLYLGFRRISKLKWSVNESVDSQVNVLDSTGLSIGQKGTSITALRPYGKARFNQKRYEVFSQGPYLPKNTPIVIIKISSQKIIVKAD